MMRAQVICRDCGLIFEETVPVALLKPAKVKVSKIKAVKKARKPKKKKAKPKKKAKKPKKKKAKPKKKKAKPKKKKPAKKGIRKLFRKLVKKKK
jgi:sRNA-binding protein